MKRSFALCLAFGLLVALAGCGGKPQPSPAAGGTYTPGTYEGKGQGYGGEVSVSITVDENAITAVTVTGDQETPTVGGAALGDLEAQIKEKGAQIDGVTGATLTSNGVKEAASAALAQAGAAG